MTGTNLTEAKLGSDFNIWISLYGVDWYDCSNAYLGGPLN